MEARNCENNFENVGFEVLFFSSGLTIPAEIIVLKASSTEISKSLTEDSGTNVYHPVVGFGAVGINTLNNFSSNSGQNWMKSYSVCLYQQRQIQLLDGIH